MEDYISTLVILLHLISVHTHRYVTRGAHWVQTMHRQYKHLLLPFAVWGIVVQPNILLLYIILLIRIYVVQWDIIILATSFPASD